MRLPHDIAARARVHAALGDPVRLAIVDFLAASDRSPGELAERVGVPSNLLAHHLDVLGDVGLIERFRSSGDGRRRYVRLVAAPPAALGPRHTSIAGPVVFVCTRNTARSQLAAALWRRRTGSEASSAGTRPAARVHPGAVAAARSAGLDLAGARPRHFDGVETGTRVITVCDRAHEELEPDAGWLHWSTRDPVEAGTTAAFEAALRELGARIDAVTGGGAHTFPTIHASDTEAP